jgi:hypothetical protein
MAGRKKKENGSGDAELEALIATGQSGAYEALQLFRSKSSRARSKGDLTAAIAAAGRGAKLLCREYEQAGYELAVLLVELLVEAGNQRLFQLYLEFMFNASLSRPGRLPR